MLLDCRSTQEHARVSLFEIQHLVIEVCANIEDRTIKGANRGQVTRAQFVLVIPQVPLFWAFLHLRIITAKTFVYTSQRWRRLRPLSRRKKQITAALHSLQIWP